MSSTTPKHPSSPIRTNLFTSHFLSTWNSRLFEFGAVLFLSTIFPGTLFPASLYALSRSASVVLFSGGIGRYVDREERMWVVRMSIVGQRAGTALSCVVLWLMLYHGYSSLDTWSSKIGLAVLSILACVEKLSSVVNTISIERDWVVVVAKGDQDDLQELNSQMRRIDLFCKLVGPLAIALIDGYSTNIAILATLGMTAISLPVEYYAIARVYHQVDDLALRPVSSNTSDPVTDTSMISAMLLHLRRTVKNIAFYIQHPAFLPSFSLSLLYLTVLTFGGQMVTYLISLGLSSTSIGLLRTVSTGLELSATWLAPKAMDKIGATRSGIWFLNWQIICVGIAAIMIWVDVNPTYAVIGLVVGTMASRIGLWGFDLSAQVIIQDAVQANDRGSFSALEASVQNIFEMLSFASTAIFAKPEQFRYPTAISAFSVAVAGFLYAMFVRRRRGHLFHGSRCFKREGYKRIWGGWEAVAQDEGDEEVEMESGL